jgi:hypothetical protein
MSQTGKGRQAGRDRKVRRPVRLAVRWVVRLAEQ